MTRARLPAGTYGQLRFADGDVKSGYLAAYGQSTTSSKPKLPASVPLDKLITVDGTGGTRYRVFAQARPSGRHRRRRGPARRRRPRPLHRLLLVEGLVIVGVLAALGLAAWFVVRIGLLPLDRMGHTAGAIAGGDLSHRVESTDPRTEVGRLGIALNAMLDRLEQAFAERQASEDRLRQFLADASHELRTPLTSIRGYAELFRIGAASDPEDTEKAMRRIEDEAARMGVLVEDLLMLARLDEVAELPHTDVDVETLARDAVDDARATAPDPSIAVEVEGPAVVVGEAHQLRQVLGNLLRNALVHTPDGTPIEVTVDARRRRRAPRGARPRAGPPDRSGRRALRALLARRGRARARQGRRRPRTRDRRGDRRRPRRARAGRERSGRRRLVRRTSARGRAPGAGRPLALRPLSGRSDPPPTRGPEAAAMTSTAPLPRPRAAAAALVDVILPVYNEQEALEYSVRRLHRFLCAEFPFTWRIVIADNASTDATPEIAQMLSERLRGVEGAAARAEGPRPRAARRLVRERRAGRLLHGHRPLDRSARAAARWSRRCSPGTATWRSARGSRTAPASCADPSAR